MKFRMLFMALMILTRLVYASQDCEICINTAELIEISKKNFDIWSAETNMKFTLLKPLEQHRMWGELSKGENHREVRLPNNDYHSKRIKSGDKLFVEESHMISLPNNMKAGIYKKNTSDGERTYRLEERMRNHEFVGVPRASVHSGPLPSTFGDPIVHAYTIPCFLWHKNREGFYLVELFLRGESTIGAGTVTYGGTEDIDGVNCQRFEASDNDSLKVTVWIAPEHNFGIKKAKIITPLEQSTISNTYEKIGDISFLKESRIENHDIHTNEKLQAYLFQTLDFKILQKEDVDDKIFVLDFPENVNVYRFDLEGGAIPVRKPQ